MEQYINKAALVAEIERRKQDAINNCGGFKSMREHECDSCIVWQYEEMENIINTLEVKVVRCKKLGGREVPRSCHVLNGRKNYCKDLFVTDEKRCNKR